MNLNLKIRSLFAVSVAVAGVAVSPCLYAAPTSLHAPVHAMFAKTKMIQLSLRNDSSSRMELKVGDTVMKLDAGKSLALSLPVGTRIVANVATATHPAGSVIEEVSKELNGTTIGIK